MKLIFQKNVSDNTHIEVWQISSSSETLFNSTPLEAEELIMYQQFQIEKRKKEFLASRYIIKRHFHKSTSIKYYPSGKPYVKEVAHLSIAHSNNYIAMAWGTQPIGVDIEKPQKKLLSIISRILSEKEIKHFQENPTVDNACKYWGAKESILKCVGDKNLNYRTHIQIRDIETGNAQYKDQCFQLYFEEVDGMILTFVEKVLS